MNILIPHTWLLEHLETQATPEQIQKLVSLSGPSIERIYEREGEPVYDIEVTTNRVDSMSVRGIAREAAVILTEAGVEATLKPLKETGHNAETGQRPVSTTPLPIIHNDPNLSKRLMCIILSNVERTPTPEWMAKRLRQIDMNVHDSVIDITNYITHELGHPCHAFDYDKLMNLGGEINVVEAQKGLSFTTLDGNSFTTVGGEVIFTDARGEVIDLPSIKGTQNASVDDSTKNILLLMESILPAKVRFASMTHAIRTTAAQLMEKNTDPYLMDETMALGIKLYEKLCHATVASPLFDEFPGRKQVSGMRFQVSEIKRYLGIEIPVERVISILESLGCIVESEADHNTETGQSPETGQRPVSTIHIVPPTFRPDLVISADIVEEIARIYGYHNLPSTLMTGEIPTTRTGAAFETEHRTKEFFAALGAIEVYTYSMISEEQARLESKVLGEETPHISLKNPLTEDLCIMRQTLWISHIDVIEKNPNRKDLSVFEFAHTYTPGIEGELPSQEFHLTLTTNGDPRRLKGMVEALAQKLYVPSLRYVSTESPYETTIMSAETHLGHIVTPSQDVSVIDLDWNTVLGVMRKYPQVRPISKYTPISEDLTFTIPPDQEIGRVLDTVRAIQNVSLISLKDIFKRNATLSLVYEADKQLTAEDATRIRKNIVDEVEQTHHGRLVGEIS